MKLQLFKYYCATCGTTTLAPELTGDVYGCFLLRSRVSGELAYVEALSDSVYHETEQILEAIPGYRKLNKFGRADALRAVFGCTCDLAQDGSYFKIGAEPICEGCGALSSMASWEATEPPEYVEKQIPHVTHYEWHNMEINEKQRLVAAEFEIFQEDSRHAGSQANSDS